MEAWNIHGGGRSWGSSSLIFIPAPLSRGEEGFLSLLSFDEQGHCVGLFYDAYLCARLILLLTLLGLPHSSVGKESACNVGDPSWIWGLGRYPGEGNGYPLQYSGLETSMDCIGQGVAKSQTRLSDFHFHFLSLSRV